MIIISIILLLAAVILFWLARRQRHSTGLPGGKVVYSDTRGWGSVEEPLYDPVLGLTGKPDYLIEKEDHLFIPVEVKSGHAPEAPYDTHIFQLAAYCLLVENIYGQRPPYGILHYSGPSRDSRTFQIDFTPQLESALLDLLTDMRRQERRKEVDRSHELPARCKSCGYRSICDQRLD